MPIATDTSNAVLIRIKAVPGAKRDQVVGRLGDRLKLRVAQPPEGGKANRAICELLATELNVKPRAASIASGESSAEKVVRIEGITAATIEARWPE